MTREEREKAGWVQEWGIYDWVDQMWLSSNGSNWTSSKTAGARWLGNSVQAHQRAVQYAATTTQPRPLWRRKKPKAPPPLAVGDEVVVRGKVRKVGAEGVLVQVELRSGRIVLPRVTDVERPGWWNGVKP